MFASDREKIRNLFADGKYIDCIEECNKLLKKSNDYYDKWGACLFIAKCFKSIKKYKEAINYCQESLNYSQNEYEKSWVQWLMAVCYEYIDIEKSIDTYNELIYFYSSHNIKECLFSVLSNRAKITKNETEALLAIKEYTKEKNINLEILDGMYENLVIIYIKTNQLQHAKKYITKIKDDQIKQRLIEQLKVA